MPEIIPAPAKTDECAKCNCVAIALHSIQWVGVKISYRGARPLQRQTYPPEESPLTEIPFGSTRSDAVYKHYIVREGKRRGLRSQNFNY